jgi:hypothetical protein
MWPNAADDDNNNKWVKDYFGIGACQASHRVAFGSLPMGRSEKPTRKARSMTS